MGCNGSKSVTVLATENGNDVDSGAERKTSVPSDVPPLVGEEPREETLDATITRPVTPQLVPPSMAFEIPFDDVADESIVKRHPPLRLQRLEEQQQQQPPVSLQELEEKQQEAEARRLQLLKLRAQSAKTKYALRNDSNDNQDENQQENEQNDKQDNQEETPQESQQQEQPEQIQSKLEERKIDIGLAEQK